MLDRFGWARATLAVLAISAPSAPATTYTWNNTGTDWSTGSTWTPAGGPPGAGDTAQFNVFNTFDTPVNGAVLSANIALAQLALSNAATGSGWSLTGGTTNTLTAGGSAISGLTVRGGGTQTIDLGNGTIPSLVLSGGTGTTTLGAIDVGAGSTLSLTGNTVAALGTSAISNRGGTLIFDSAAGNPSAQRITSTGQINLTGGGSTLEFRGATGGSTFNGLSGALSMGSGDGTIRIVQSGGASVGTAVTFGSLIRTNTSATIDFVNGGSGTLGGGGAADPSIKFTTAPSLTNGVISTAAASAALGFALYNGTDFAGYDATRGVVAVASTNVAGSLSTAGTQNSNLTGNSTIAASTTVAFNTLKISPTASGQSLSIGAAGVLNTVGILLRGNTDYAISGGAIGGATFRYIHVTDPTATLSIGSNLAGSAQSITFAGGGFVTLTGSVNQIAIGTSQNVNLTGGTLRVTAANFDLTKPAAPAIRLRGGVLEYDVTGADFTFGRALGTTSGTVNWATAAAPGVNTGSGGFSAYAAGGDHSLLVNLGGATSGVTWGGQTGSDLQFVQEGYALKFGSSKSNATVAFQNPIALDIGTTSKYAIREIDVARGVGNATDLTRLTGKITGTSSTDLLKTGGGVLSLISVNTYAGNTIVSGGTLLAGNPTSSFGSGTGTVSVGSGATLGSDGDGGRIKEAVFVRKGGTVRGDYGAGTGALAFEKAVSIAGDATDGGRIQTTVSATGNSTLDIAAATLILADGGGKFKIDLVKGATAVPSTYTVVLASKTSGIFRLGTTTLAAGDTIDANRYDVTRDFQIGDAGAYVLQVDGTGNKLQLTFTPVPEPGAMFAAGAAGLALFGALRRYRRRRATVG